MTVRILSHSYCYQAIALKPPVGGALQMEFSNVLPICAEPTTELRGALVFTGAGWRSTQAFSWPGVGRSTAGHCFASDRSRLFWIPLPFNLRACLSVLV